MCTRDNALADARALSLRTHARTMQQLLLTRRQFKEYRLRRTFVSEGEKSAGRAIFTNNVFQVVPSTVTVVCALLLQLRIQHKNINT